MSSSLHHYRARVAGLSRDRAADDPELVSARRELAAEKLAAYVRNSLATAPPFTPEQRDTIISAFGLVAA